jgi:Family of unknown function (DUF6159)
MPDPTPSKFARSWLLFTTSLQVVRQNKKLLLFPVVTSVCSVVMVLFFFAPALLYLRGHAPRDPAHWQSLGHQLGFDFAGGESALRPNAIFYGYLAVVYLVSMFLATFFNAAFYNEILKALAGEPVSIRSGLRFAWFRVRSILMWSLLAGTVGLIIKALEERLGWIGQWVMRLVGVVWSVASIFAIPVLIREGGTNPVTMLRQSAAVLRKTWGESLVGYVGITIGSWIILLGSLVFLAGAIMLSVALQSPLFAFLAVLAWLGAMFSLGYLVAVAGHVYRCALYVYASEGVVPAPYTPELMDAAWKIKKA